MCIPAKIIVIFPVIFHEYFFIFRKIYTHAQWRLIYTSKKSINSIKGTCEISHNRLILLLGQLISICIWKVCIDPKEQKRLRTKKNKTTCYCT